MEAQYDPLLDPFNFADEAGTSALTPQELQSLKKKKKNETANNIRHNVCL